MSQKKKKKAMIFFSDDRRNSRFFPSAFFLLFNIKMVVVIIENRDTPGYMRRILSVRTLSGFKGGVEKEGLTLSMPHSNSGAFQKNVKQDSVYGISVVLRHVFQSPVSFPISIPSLRAIESIILGKSLDETHSMKNVGKEGKK